MSGSNFPDDPEMDAYDRFTCRCGLPIWDCEVALMETGAPYGEAVGGEV